tara:strand:+ start:65 stop:388 length:324 start_codon:yes stop_codon:yes gene_type:complete
MADTETARKVLEARQKDIEARLARIESDLGEPLLADSDDRAIQLEDDESLEGQAAVLSRDLASTQRALLRIEDGTYGDCVQCGAQIPDGRLEARPEAALCIACARQG